MIIGGYLLEIQDLIIIIVTELLLLLQVY